MKMGSLKNMVVNNMNYDYDKNNEKSFIIEMW